MKEITSCFDGVFFGRFLERMGCGLCQSFIDFGLERVSKKASD